MILDYLVNYAKTFPVDQPLQCSAVVSIQLFETHRCLYLKNNINLWFLRKW